MPRSLFDPPDRTPEAEPPLEPLVRPRTPAPGTARADAPAAPPPTRRRRLVVAMVLSSFLGGTAATGALLATGVIGTAASDGATTTVVQSPSTRVVSSSSSGAAAAGIDAAALYKSTAAGVVDITARGSSNASAEQLPNGVPQEQAQTSATGTGFVVDDAGHVVTAAHVIDDASSITIRMQDGTTRSATLLGQDDATDVAVLKFDPAGLTLAPLTLGSSAALEVGDALAAIGDPFGYERSISTGIVSGLDRTIQAPNGFTVAHAIQTDAALNPGNSGGPVVNAAGEVIGIADQIATNGSSGVNSGVGFAVPIDLVKTELDNLKAGKTVEHAYFGVATTEHAGAGALVQQVTAGSPAADAGIKAGDVVTAIGATKIDDANALVGAIAARKPGDKVDVTVKRGVQTSKHSVTLGTQPAGSRSTTLR